MPTIPPYATLFDVVLRLAREVLITRSGVATGGSTTTLEDTSFPFTPGIFKGGTVFNLVNKEFSRITQQSDTRLTFPAMTITVAGNLYTVAGDDFPLDVLVSALNTTMRDLIIPDEDETLSVVSGQDEYILPANVSQLYKVEIAISAAVPYNYQEHFHWDEANGCLRFPMAYQPAAAGVPIRLTFRKVHTDLVNHDDAIPDGVNLDYLLWAAAENVAKYGLKVFGADTKRDFPSKIQEYEVRRQRAATAQVRLQRSPRLADW